MGSEWPTASVTARPSRVDWFLPAGGVLGGDLLATLSASVSPLDARTHTLG